MKKNCFFLIIIATLIPMITIFSWNIHAEEATGPIIEQSQQNESFQQNPDKKIGIPVEPRKAYAYVSLRYKEPKAFVINNVDELKQFFLDFFISPNETGANIEAQETYHDIDSSHEVFVAVARQPILETCKTPGKMLFYRLPGGVLKASVQLDIIENCSPAPTDAYYSTIDVMIFEKPVTKVEATFFTKKIKLPGFQDKEK